MKLTEIQDLIKFVARSGVTEVEIEQADFKITIKSESATKKLGKGQQKQEVYMQPMPIAMPHMGMPQIQNQMQPQTQAPATQTQNPKVEEKSDNSSKYVTIKSPMIGTFYRSAGPDKDAFVSVGDDIKPGKVICIIEAMKLFNEIEAEISGKIMKVLVDDATPVQYDQPLFLVDPV